MSWKAALGAWLAVLTVATTFCRAATIVTVTHEQTPTAPGFCTHILKLTSDAGNIIGFNFATPFGITGAEFRQVNPFDFVTVVNDVPAEVYSLAGSHIKADTHFLVRSADGIVVNMSESDMGLHGAFNLSSSNAASATPSMVVAQIVTPRGSRFRAFGEATVATPTGNRLEAFDWVPSLAEEWNCPVPEPASGVLLAGRLLLQGTRRRLNA